MLKKLLNLVMVMMLGLFLYGSPAEAASLQKEDATIMNHTAVIVVEDISNKEFIQVIDLSGIKKMSSAVKWIEDNASGRNLRFTSSDPEMIESWKQATIEAGFKVKNAKENHKKLSQKAIRVLERGDKYSFEIKTIKSQGGNDLEKGISYVMGIAGLVAAFN